MSELAEISELVPDVLLDCPDLEEGLAQEHLQAAAKDFFTRAEVLSETIELATVDGQASYSLAVTTPQMIITRILAAKLEGAVDPLDARSYNLDFPTRALVFGPSYVPNRSGLTLTVKLALRPERRATVYPAWALNDYEAAIVARALSKLHLLKGKPWSDPGLAQARLAEYNAAVIAARGEKNLAGTNRDERMGG